MMNRLIGFNSHITSSHDVSSCGKRKLKHATLDLREPVHSC